MVVSASTVIPQSYGSTAKVGPAYSGNPQADQAIPKHKANRAEPTLPVSPSSYHLGNHLPSA